MKRRAIGLVGLAAIGFGGIYQGNMDLRYLRQQEGAKLCKRLERIQPAEFERLNVADGMKPDTPFSLDDYCGHACRPDSLMWNDCVDSCIDFCADSAGERE